MATRQRTKPCLTLKHASTAPPWRTKIYWKKFKETRLKELTVRVTNRDADAVLRGGNRETNRPVSGRRLVDEGGTLLTSCHSLRCFCLVFGGRRLVGLYWGTVVRRRPAALRFQVYGRRSVFFFLNSSSNMKVHRKYNNNYKNKMAASEVNRGTRRDGKPGAHQEGLGGEGRSIRKRLRVGPMKKKKRGRG